MRGWLDIPALTPWDFDIKHLPQELKCLGTFLIVMTLFTEMIHCSSLENWENKQKEKSPNLPPSHHPEMITTNILEHVLPLFLI